MHTSNVSEKSAWVLAIRSLIRIVSVSVIILGLTLFSAAHAAGLLSPVDGSSALLRIESHAVNE